MNITPRRKTRETSLYYQLPGSQATPQKTAALPSTAQKRAREYQGREPGFPGATELVTTENHPAAPELAWAASIAKHGWHLSNILQSSCAELKRMKNFCEKELLE